MSRRPTVLIDICGALNDAIQLREALIQKTREVWLLRVYTCRCIKSPRVRSATTNAMASRLRHPCVSLSTMWVSTIG